MKETCVSGLLICFRLLRSTINGPFLTDLIFVHGKVLWGWQLAQGIDAKIIHEFFGGAVKNRAADGLGFPFDLHKAFLQKFMYSIVAIYPADLLHLNLGHRLFIGDDGEGFKGRG